MATLPNYLQEQTEEAIRRRMLDSLPSDLDKSEGSFIWDALSPAAIELAQAAIWAQEVLRRGFASTTFGPYLDLRCEEHGITRRPAVKSTGQVEFTGKPGTVIAAGTRVATAADAVNGVSSIEFMTKAAVTVGENGSVTADIEAVKPGTSGNVPAGSIVLVITPVPGLIGVTNPSALEGGIDTEEDASLLSRYLQKVRSPSAGGNKADYVNWALEVAGVGGVSVVPVRDGPGTVSVSIIDTNGEPASLALVEAVQNYIAPPWTSDHWAKDQTTGGSGISIDGDSVKMEYDAQDTGSLTQAITDVLPQAGLWHARVRVKVDNVEGSANLLQVGMYNLTTQDWAKTTQGGTEDALIVFKGEQLSETFAYVHVPFYWNGSDQLQLRVIRLQDDPDTVVWIDRIEHRSAYSKDTGEGKAPIGAKVKVEPATAVLIHVSATLTIAPGYSADSVKAAVRQNISGYIRSLAFTDDNDVRHVRIGQAILDTPGVQDYKDLLVNGGTGNVAIGIQEVAVLGTVTLT